MWELVPVFLLPLYNWGGPPRNLACGPGWCFWGGEARKKKKGGGKHCLEQKCIFCVSAIILQQKFDLNTDFWISCPQAAAYGKCVTATTTGRQELRKDLCGKEFDALKTCFVTAVSGILQVFHHFLLHFFCLWCINSIDLIILSYRPRREWSRPFCPTHLCWTSTGVFTRN